MIEELKKGYELKNGIDNINSGDLMKKAKKITTEVIKQQKKKECYFIVDSRVYEITSNYIRYYSLNGQGKYYYVTEFNQIYDFLTKPKKENRRLKLIITDKDLSRKEIKKLKY